MRFKMNNRFFVSVLSVVAALALSPDVSAQDIPRTPDGKPDFSGDWGSFIGPPQIGSDELSVFQGGNADKRLTRREKGLRNIPLAEWGREAFLYYTAGDGEWDGETGASLDPRYHDGSCAGPRAPSDLPGNVHIYQTPQVLMLTYMSRQPWIRKIWLDRQHPEDLTEYVPFWMGHSVGNWDGDTLVADTVRIKEGTPISTRQAIPQSGDLRMIERFSFNEDGTLHVERTFEDPVAFTRQWSDEVTLERQTDWDYMYFDWEIEENHDVCDPQGGFWREYDPWFDNFDEIAEAVLPDHERLDQGLPLVPEEYRQK